MKVKLISAYKTEYQSYLAGQTGEARFYPNNEFAVVTFDGYADEKEEAQKFKARTGEFPNIVPFKSEIPVNLLQRMED